MSHTTITIPEIAQQLSVTQSQVSHLLATHSTMPKPLFKRVRILYFDRVEMQAWLDARIARMAGNAVSGRRRTEHDAPCLDNAQAQLFLRGGFKKL